MANADADANKLTDVDVNGEVDCVVCVIVSGVVVFNEFVSRNVSFNVLMENRDTIRTPSKL